MCPCWALMLRFDAPLAWDLDAAFVNQGPLGWMARDSSKPGRPRHETWVLHATADWSHEHLEDDPADVARAMLKAFADLGGAAPAAWTAHRWRYATHAPAQSGINGLMLFHAGKTAETLCFYFRSIMVAIPAQIGDFHRRIRDTRTDQRDNIIRRHRHG